MHRKHGDKARRPASAGVSIRKWLDALATLPVSTVRASAEDDTAPLAERVAAARLLSAMTDGKDFDRICDRTEGKPVTRANNDANGCGPPLGTPEERGEAAARLLAELREMVGPEPTF